MKTQLKRRKASPEKPPAANAEVNDASDSEGGFDSESSDEPAQDRRPAKRARNSKGKAGVSRISSDAIASLTTAGTRSRLLQLQALSMLEELRPARKRRADVDSVLRELKKTVEAAEAREQRPICEAEALLTLTSQRRASSKEERVRIPFPEPRPAKDSNLKLAFERPVYVDIVGSYVSGTSIVEPIISPKGSTNGEISIDMVVCMPSKLFQEKDYLDLRYAYKRAYYLAVLAQEVSKSSVGQRKDSIIEFSSLKGNALQPIITVRFSNKGGKQSREQDTIPFRVNIIPILETPPPFALHKLAFEKCAIRTEAQPTPFYNSTILMDCCFGQISAIIRKAIEIAPNFVDACILGRVWLLRRGFSSSIHAQGFGGFEWAAILATLLGAADLAPGARPVISPGCSSFQMFRAMLHFLASRDLCSSPFGASRGGEDSTELLPLFVLPGLGMNVLFKMKETNYRTVRRAFTTAANILSQTEKDVTVQSEEAFRRIWGESTLETFTSVGQYDFVVRVDLADASTKANAALKDPYSLLLSKATKLQQVLIRGLDDRVVRVDVRLPKPDSWGVNETPSAEFHTEIVYGLSVNPANAERLVDLGPKVEAKAEAASFREFWGDKSELRRFKDGTIRESCVWSERGGSSGNEERVIEQVVRYLVEKHAGFRALTTLELSGGVDLIDQIVKSPAPASSASGCFQPIINSFQALQTAIRELDQADSLPLRIRSFSAADEQLRYASVYTPDPTEPVPADAVLQFEYSSRWPDDLDAIQRTKIAFLLKISDCLAEREQGYSSQVGLENADIQFQNVGFLDVRTPDGFVFRLRIHHEREQELLSNIIKGPSVSPFVRDAASAALASFERLYLKRPRHTTAISSSATRIPVFSETVRLLKLWFSRNGLLPHFPPELVELFVAKTFAGYDTETGDTPGTGVASFIRTLEWISVWNWKTHPLMVKLDDNTDADVESANSEDAPKPIANADKLIQAPNPARFAMSVGTNLDPDGTVWTKEQPTALAASFLTSLAQKSIEKLKRSAKRSDEGTDFEAVFASLFSPSKQPFEFVLHLNEKAIASLATSRSKPSKKVKAGQFKNLVLASSQSASTSQFSQNGPFTRPCHGQVIESLVDDITSAYGSVLTLFWDPVDGTRIGGAWNPAFTAPRRWKPRIGISALPLSSEPDENGDPLVTLNKKAVLGEVWRIGGDLIKRVDGL